jgi:predicted small lipoprotein YifL
MSAKGLSLLVCGEPQPLLLMPFVLFPLIMRLQLLNINRLMKDFRFTLLLLSLALSGCGQPGPLYLPGTKPPFYVPPEEITEPEAKEKETDKAKEADKDKNKALDQDKSNAPDENAKDKEPSPEPQPVPGNKQPEKEQ